MLAVERHVTEPNVSVYLDFRKRLIWMILGYVRKIKIAYIFPFVPVCPRILSLPAALILSVSTNQITISYLYNLYNYNS